MAKGDVRMSRPCKTIVAPALAGTLPLMTRLDPAAAASRHHASSHHRNAATQSYSQSYDVVPGSPSDAARSPRFDSRYGASTYPYGPGRNFPYPDRPYGDPDHW